MKDKKTIQESLRRLPSVARLLESERLKSLSASFSLARVTENIRLVLEAERTRLLQAPTDTPSDTRSDDALIQEVVNSLEKELQPSLQAAINATGIVLHTGLGRARLSAEARDAVLEVANSHCLLEIERESGKRGSRRDHVRGLLRELTGAEDATVVNNCAGAVFLAIQALALGREVLISRGELVEIGGAFRMPDIIRSGGAKLIEVGTTNRTRIQDYAGAITPETGLILRCHPSNFAIIGFTERAETSELVALGRQHGIPVMDDQGSGAIIPLSAFMPQNQKGTLQESVVAGCDIVTASGDKLLGGPQVGLVLGKKATIDRIVKHPLARALRVDKFTLAALEATLRLYRNPQLAIQQIPTLRYLARNLPELRKMAQSLKRRLLAEMTDGKFQVRLIDENSEVGGGSLPGETLPTVCVGLRSVYGNPSAEILSKRLRLHNPSIFARIKADEVLFDPRTLEENEIQAVARACATLVNLKDERG